MESYTTRLDKSGRILIPAAVRRHLGLSAGSPVLLKVDSSGALHLTSRAKALANAREEIRRSIPPGQNLVEELLRDRRADLIRETGQPPRP